MILLIDNYDSFTYNLVHRIGEIDARMPIEVVRNDQISVEQAELMRPTRLIISPGPCTPNESGISTALIDHFRGTIPILGVCLGHQAIAQVHGMRVRRHHVLMHGKTSEIHHDNRGIFEGLPNPFAAARYHSLIVDDDSLCDDFDISAWTSAGEVMGLRWKGAEDQAPMDGVQFHPESFLTVDGSRLLSNFLQQALTRMDESENLTLERR